MLTKEDIAGIESRGSSVAEVSSQLERFRKGFPWMDIVAPATPERGIKVLSEEAADEAVEYARTASVAGKCKFVPASGAASRMFKDIFSGLAAAEAGEKLPEDAPLSKLSSRLREFAFYDGSVFPSEDPAAVGAALLREPGLGYGSKPKGVLKFHRYPGEVRTAFAEHLVEGQEYMRDPDGTVRLVVTISPEHRPLFEEALDEVRAKYEARYGVRYDVSFTYQSPATDTIAVDPSNEPFRKEDGSLLFRPAGHGALIRNLSEVDAELVSIKNIDNVCLEGGFRSSGSADPLSGLALTARWKQVLAGRALQLRDRVFGYIFALDQFAAAQPLSLYPYLPGYNALETDPYASDEAQALCREIEDFLSEEFCVEIPPCRTCRERAEALRRKLDRPLRVCGMVRNSGEPGGGPFIIRGRDGSTSLQILESVQINPDDPAAVSALRAATHFNPVDLVCCLRDSSGAKFDLPRYVDPDAGFISSKSYQGRPLRALELPGLWNGSMADWNTSFVEVPAETFNPVKTVLDLLRPAHNSSL